MPTPGAKGQGQLHPNPMGEMVPGPVLCLLALRFLLCIAENAISLMSLPAGSQGDSANWRH